MVVETGIYKEIGYLGSIILNGEGVIKVCIHDLDLGVSSSHLVLGVIKKVLLLNSAHFKGSNHTRKSLNSVLVTAIISRKLF